MSAGFTKGPWSVSTRNPNNFTINADDGRVAYTGISQISKRRAEGEANARLIAASPELYTQLEIAASVFRDYERLHKAKGTAEGDSKAARNAERARHAEAALAKARGEA